jgi:hypothetical protein
MNPLNRQYRIQGGSFHQQPGEGVRKKRSLTGDLTPTDIGQFLANWADALERNHGGTVTPGLESALMKMKLCATPKQGSLEIRLEWDA